MTSLLTRRLWFGTDRTNGAMPLVWLLLCLLGFAAGCSVESNATKCRVLVAASAREATQKSIDSFVKSNDSIVASQIVVVSGSSNGLSQQILAGAPANIFIAANPKWTAAIAAQCLANEEFVGNRLAVATHRLNSDLNIQSIRDLKNPKVENIAIAAKSVPLGDYARQALGRSQELQTALESKLVFGKDASALVAWLKNREADYGFVYASDLQRSSELVEALAIDPSYHDPITYSIAKLKSDQVDPSALRDQVYSWLRSETSMQIYKDSGFVPMHEKPPAVSNPIE